MIDKRAIRAGVDEQHRPAPAQADDALHERADRARCLPQRFPPRRYRHRRAAPKAAGDRPWPRRARGRRSIASPSPSNWKRSTPAPRNAPARASEKSPAPAASTHRRSRWPNTRRASSTAVSASAAVEADASAADRALDRPEAAAASQGQGVAQRARLPRLRQGARPTGGQRSRRARRTKSPAASRLRQISRIGKPVAFPGEATRLPGAPGRTRPGRTRRRTSGRPRRSPRRNRARRPPPPRPQHRKARRRYRRRRTPPRPPRTAPRARRPRPR